MVRQRDFSAYDFRAGRTDRLTGEDREAAHGLFDVAYRQANHAYLEKSFTRLRFFAIARRDGEPAGFALSDARRMPLPRLEGLHYVSLGGICCIAPQFRRRGLFGRLEGLAGSEARLSPGTGRRLGCGRMAHPASFRGMSRNPTVVPKMGATPGAWQQEVGLAVAEVYGSRLDPETFVCVGDGTPIGYPEMEIEATEQEWEIFRRVDRDRGDSLLAIAWSPDAPEGWDAP